MIELLRDKGIDENWRKGVIVLLFKTNVEVGVESFREENSRNGYILLIKINLDVCPEKVRCAPSS